MPRPSSFRPVFIREPALSATAGEGPATPRSSPLLPVFAALLLFSQAHAAGTRPFDWQYTRLSAPFAVFYNPSLLGNNPGYTFGVDARHVDSADYDVRGAVVVPVSRVLRHGDQIRENGSNRYLRYANTSYRSSRTAVSLGGTYEGGDNYKISAGIATPVKLVHSGLAFDLMYEGSEPKTALKAGFAADIPRLMRGGTLYIVLNNLAVSERDSTNRLGLQIGTGGIPFSDPRMYYLPYDLFFYFQLHQGKVDRVEGMARVNLDLAYVHTARETFGQAVSASLGYNFIRRSNGIVDHKFFASLGVVFINRSSSSALLGSYGEGEEKYGTFFYNYFRKGAAIASDSDIKPAVSMREADSGKVLFGLESGGANITSWVLRIENQRGANIRTFSGGNTLPSSVLWDGLSWQGEPVEDEVVYAKLVLKGEKRVAESDAVMIEKKLSLP